MLKISAIKNTSLLTVSAIPQHFYLLIKYQLGTFPGTSLCSMKLYTTRVTMTILATAPPIYMMGACQNTDKIYFIVWNWLQVFIVGNKNITSQEKTILQVCQWLDEY